MEHPVWQAEPTGPRRSEFVSWLDWPTKLGPYLGHSQQANSEPSVTLAALPWRKEAAAGPSYLLSSLGVISSVS